MSAGQPIAEPLWAEMRARAEPVTCQELRIKLGVLGTSVILRLRRWEHAGLVRNLGLQTRAGPRGGVTLAFILTEEAQRMTHPPRIAADGAPARRSGKGRQRIWTAIRILKRFNRVEAEQASEQSRRSVEDYINCLLRAAYIRRLRAANPHTGALAVYEVVRNTGRKAPSVRHGLRSGTRFREVADPNDGSRHDISPRAKAAPSDAI